MQRQAAKPVLLLLSLCLVGAIYAAISPATQSSAEGATNEQLVTTGKQLFAVSCASCHGLNGEGFAQQGAPSLTNVGAAAVDFQVRTGRMPMANPLVQAPRKDNTFTEDEIAALAAFVASLGDGPAIPTEDQYDTSRVDAEGAARGGEMFRTTVLRAITSRGQAVPCPTDWLRRAFRASSPRRSSKPCAPAPVRCRCSRPGRFPTRTPRR